MLNPPSELKTQALQRYQWQEKTSSALADVIVVGQQRLPQKKDNVKWQVPMMYRSR